MESATSPPLSPSIDEDLHKRMERMAHAAMANKARRGKATMLQKALDPGAKHGKESDWDSCSESSCDSLSALRLSPRELSPRSFCGRPDTLSPIPHSTDLCTEQGQQAKHLMSRLMEMGIEPIVDGPSALPNSSFGSMSMSFCSSPFPPALHTDGIDPRALIFRPPPQRAMVECRITRDKTDQRYPKFEMFLEHGQQFLLAARKRKLNTTSNYLVSTGREDLHRHSANYIGKLRSNFLGTEFVIFDNGERHATGTAAERRTLGCVLYEPNVLGAKGPRKMSVAVPMVNEDGEMLDFTPSPDDGEHFTFLEHVLSGNRLGIVVLRSVEPEWVPEKQTFVLDFNGRVKKSSVKNFQLREDGKRPILMQFGKVDTDEYILDFQHPFNALQAFAVALSSFDSKLACE